MNPPAALRSVQFCDVHPLHGGRALRAERRGGKFVQIVARGGADTRWRAPQARGAGAGLGRVGVEPGVRWA